MRISDWSSDVCSSDLDLRDRADGVLEALEVAGLVTLQLDLHQELGCRRDLLQRHLRMVAADEAGLVEALQAVPAGRRREAHPGGQLRLGDAPLRLEDGDRKSTRLNSSHSCAARMPSSA